MTDEVDDYGVHMTHCNLGEYDGTCKYGDHDCPALPPERCAHDYKETSSIHDMDGETYECVKCGDRYRLYYEDMK